MIIPMRASNIAAIAALVIVLVLVFVALFPMYQTYTTGTTTGVPEKHSHRWSMADFAHMQYRYAKALKLSPRQLLRGMLLGITPGPDTTPEQNDIARNALSSRASTFVRWKENMHAPATELARKIDKHKPLVLLSFTAGLDQLTRLKERGLVEWTPEVIVLYGGYLSDEDWQKTRETWHPARVEQFYGASECCPIIATRDDDGAYRLASNTNIRVDKPGKKGVWVWGFPSHNWTHLDDAITQHPDGRFDIEYSRQKPYDAAVWKGLDAVSQGVLDAFQIQQFGSRAYKVAYVSENTPDHVSLLFESTLPGSTFSAVQGEAHFRPSFGKSIKRVGYVDLTAP
jgi:hypothetical protein